MSQIDTYLQQYGESHQNATNKMIHWVCVPAIMFSLFGILYSIPFPVERSLLTNWAAVFMLLTLMYYLKLSFTMFLGFIIIGGLMMLGIDVIYKYVDFDPKSLAYISLSIFVVAWIAQFIGHKIEGKKPSFLDDVKFLLVGPLWLLHFIYNKMGVKY